MKLSSENKITGLIKSNFHDLFDEKIGLITEIREYADRLKTPLYSYFAASKLGENTQCNGSAVATDRDNALSKSIGECLERYCLFAYDYKPFIQTSCNSPSNRYSCLLPEQVEIYTPDELKRLSFNCYTESLETFFCIGYNLAKNEYQYIPLPMVYLRSHFFELYPKELNIIQQTISTGAAFGYDFYQTALTATYEVIERDAMMAFWLLGREVPKIDLATLNPTQRCFVSEIVNNDIQVLLFDISVNDHVFVILSCLCSNNPIVPSVVFSAAAHHDLDTAIQKALEEVVSTFGLAEILLRKDPGGYNKLINHEDWASQIVDRNDHVRFWSYKKIFETYGSALDFIFKGKKIVSREDLLTKNKTFVNDNHALCSIVELLKRDGYDLLLVDITTSDVNSLGFLSLKAVIPGFLPLHLGYRFTYSKPKRLLQIAQANDQEYMPEFALNKTPHPFP